MTFVDTNYFLHFLIKDNIEQYEESKELFLKGANGKLKLVTSSLVIFEIYWVFKSYYQKTKPEIIDIIQKILGMDFVEVEQRDLLQESLTVFQNEPSLRSKDRSFGFLPKGNKNLSLEDCYNLVYAKSQRVNSFKTFDQDLLKVFASGFR